MTKPSSVLSPSFRIFIDYGKKTLYEVWLRGPYLENHVSNSFVVSKVDKKDGRTLVSIVVSRPVKIILGYVNELESG